MLIRDVAGGAERANAEESVIVQPHVKRIRNKNVKKLKISVMAIKINLLSPNTEPE